MTRPLVSIVIPSRNGAKTLGSTIASCLAQDLDDYEVVVHDTGSGPGNRQVVEGFGSDHVRYFRHDDSSLSMAANWNAALAHARGEWITFLGDDDGICPGALSTAMQAQQKHDVRIMRWPWATYQWPDMPTPGQANKLSIPLLRRTAMVSTEERLLSMVETGAWPILPQTYHSMVHRSLIDEALTTGPVFDGIAPDLFSGVLFSRFTDQFLELPKPLTVLAFSGNSISVSQFAEGGSDESRRDFDEQNAGAGLFLHPELPNVVVSCTLFWDAIFRARDRLFPKDDRFRVDRKRIAQLTLDMIPSLPSGQRDAAIAEVLDFLRKTEDGSDFEPELPGPADPDAVFYPALGPLGSTAEEVILDASRFGVIDVAGACELVDRIMELEPVIASRDTLYQRMVAERDAYIAERDGLRMSLDAYIAERDELVIDREVWVARAREFETERDELTRELAEARRRFWQR